MTRTAASIASLYRFWNTARNNSSVDNCNRTVAANFSRIFSGFPFFPRRKDADAKKGGRDMTDYCRS